MKTEYQNKSTSPFSKMTVVKRLHPDERVSYLEFPDIGETNIASKCEQAWGKGRLKQLTRGRLAWDQTEATK